MSIVKMDVKVVTTIAEVKQAIREAKSKAGGNKTMAEVGYVPTMGFLHDGHASLIKRARSECGVVVLSIFVNPIQFGPNEDFERYPRDAERDLKVAAACGADIVFMPEVSEMYPQYPVKTKVSVTGNVTAKLCGATRPGHFDGVATVISKFYHIIGPDRMYFGMKDAQQVAVIEQMKKDLNMDVVIVPCPIIREADGLALSSRNVYLTAEQRKQALVLSESLRNAEDWLKEDGKDFSRLKERITRHIQTAPLADIDYVETVIYPDLEPLNGKIPEGSGPVSVLVALAVKFGRTRLIDNRLFPDIQR